MKKNLAYSLGYQVLYDCNRVSVVEPAAIIATVRASIGFFDAR